MMDVEEDNEKELHVLRSAVLASMKAKLKQKEKASKSGSPLPDNDIEHDPELAALRTVALMSKKEKEEQARKAAILKQQQQYQFRQGTGVRSNLIMIKTLDLDKTNPPDPNKMANAQEVKKVSGKFNRYDNSDSEEEEEEEEEQLEKLSENSEPESSDNDEEMANQSDSNKENRDSSDDKGDSDANRTSSSDSDSDSSASSSSSEESSSESSSSENEDDNVTNETVEVKKENVDLSATVNKEHVKVKKEPPDDSAEKNNGSLKKSSYSSKRNENRLGTDSKLLNDRLNSTIKTESRSSSSRTYASVKSEKDRLSPRDGTKGRYTKEPLRDNRHKTEHSRKDRREHIDGRDNRSKYQSNRHREQKDGRSLGSHCDRRVEGSVASHRKDAERDRLDNKGSRENSRDQARSNNRMSSANRTGDMSSRDRRLGGRSRDRSDRLEDRSNTKDSLRVPSKQYEKQGEPRKTSSKSTAKIVNEKLKKNNSKNSQSFDRKKKTGIGSQSSAKLVHSSDSSFSESGGEDSKSGTGASSESDSDSESEGRNKHRRSERNTEDIERERRKRRVAEREKKDAEAKQNSKEDGRERRRHGNDGGHRKDEVDRKRNRPPEVDNKNNERSRKNPGNSSTNSQSNLVSGSRICEHIRSSDKKSENIRGNSIQNRVDTSGSHLSDSKVNNNKLSILSRVGAKTKKEDRLKPPPALSSRKNTDEAHSVIKMVKRRKSTSSEKIVLVNDDKKAKLMQEIERIDQKLAAKRSATLTGVVDDRMSKSTVEDMANEQKESSVKSSKFKRKEAPSYSSEEVENIDRPKKVKRSHSPVRTRTLKKEPETEDQPKSAPSKKSVHERLGNVVAKDKLSSNTNKSTRRVISLEKDEDDLTRPPENKDGDLRNLLHRRKPKVRHLANDVTVDNYADEIQVKRQTDLGLGRKVMVYEEGLFEVELAESHTGAGHQRLVGSSGFVQDISAPTSVASKVRRIDHKKEDRDYRGEDTTVLEQKVSTTKKKVTLKRPVVEKDPVYESELDARIKQIQEKNTAILQRQKQIEAEKRKFSAK